MKLELERELDNKLTETRKLIRDEFDRKLSVLAKQLAKYQIGDVVEFIDHRVRSVSMHPVDHISKSVITSHCIANGQIAYNLNDGCFILESQIKNVCECKPKRGAKK
jgi:hypothetical protein